jgi:integrase
MLITHDYFINRIPDIGIGVPDSGIGVPDSGILAVANPHLTLICLLLKTDGKTYIKNRREKDEKNEKNACKKRPQNRRCSLVTCTCPTCGQRTLFPLEPQSDGTFECEFWKWITYLEASGSSPHHLRNLKSYTKHHLSPALATMDVHRITTRVIHNLYLDLLKKGLASKTVKHVLSVVSGLLNHLYRLETIERVPAFPRVRVVAKEKAWLDPSGQFNILAQIDNKYSLYFRILLETGIRPGECRGLKVKDFNGTTLIVSRALDERGTVRPTKTGRTYRYQISEQLEHALTARYAAHLPEAFLFNLKRTSIHRAWRAACDRAGVRIPMYQAARHSRASQVNAEVEVYRRERLREALQHESATTTMKYYTLDESRRVTV